MFKLKEFILSYKTHLIIGTIFLLLISSLSISLYFNFKDNKEETILNVDNLEKTSPITEEDLINIEEYIYVDIKGYVTNPGVYKVTKGTRVIDVINLSGGLTKYATTKYINLSKIVEDENVIYINSKYEIEKIINKTMEEEVVPNIENNSAKIEEKDLITNNIEEKNDTSSSTITTNTKVNINTATIEDLCKLNGIGEAKAKAIIEYRTTNGLFKNIEELKNVSGIGDKAYDEIKESITIE